MRQSIATIASPEFINLQPLDINPLMSKCEIKVLYIGENRNRSFITKEVATEMSKTLRGAPIVGYFNEDKEDFVDHGDRVTIDGDGVRFECLTTPYGFVSPDAEVWFQKFEDTDDFGNVVEREYLMTTGYLWTGQFKEIESALKEGRPQSMELDNETLRGSWSTNTKTGIEFFIINDAIFSKLCILGTDVEPCFEGASIEEPKVSNNFTLDEKFRKTLFSMIQDLKFVLEEGGQQVEKVPNEVTPEVDFVEEEDVETNPVTEETEEVTEESVEKVPEADTNVEDFSSEENSPVSEEVEPAENVEVVNEYEKLKVEYSELQEKYQALEEEYNSLVEYKKESETKEKEELINSFYMLSDEDKQDVVENIEKYSYDEIEAKLSVICVRKKVNFSVLDEPQEGSIGQENFTYNIDNSEQLSESPIVRALKNKRKSK